ncbi:MAG TPA: bifunctional RNase H/acid phosphatase, partial [Mycobacteriales bacterium]|nr:bifunctional RNase H/acid phosphatase [Mycobacteriales bacterium]
LAAEAAALVRQLPRVRFHHIPRERNRHADRLANEAMDAAARGREWKRRPVAEPGAADPGGSSAGGSSAGAASRGAASGGAASGGNRLAGWMAAPAPPTATLLLRHGETRWTAEKRFCGSTDLPLTERGQAQGAAVAERLAEGGIERLVGGRPGRIVSSPLVRARETAALVADRLGVPVTVEDALRETDFGAWEGATFAEAQEQWPSEVAAWLADPELAPPGGESFASTSRRVRAARDRLLSDYPGEPVLVVAHVTPIKQLLRFALDAPPVALYRMQLDPAGLSVVDFYADGPSVVRLVNDTSHLVT